MKRIAVSLAALLISHSVFAKPLKVSLITDVAPGRATVHGLEELRHAIQAKNIQIDSAREQNAAAGDIVVVIGLSAGTGPAAIIASEHSIAPPTQTESLFIHKLNRGQKPLLLISGADDRGLMYALLDVAERVG